MQPSRLWIVRFLIGLVLLLNLQCAALFLISPGSYVAGFGLEGEVGISVLRGVGILFLMWNVPYAVAVSHPLKRIISLYESLAMQAIGLIGESWLYVSILPEPSATLAALQRFIIFDGLGLVSLILAALIVKRESV